MSAETGTESSSSSSSLPTTIRLPTTIHPWSKPNVVDQLTVLSCKTKKFHLAADDAHDEWITIPYNRLGLDTAGQMVELKKHAQQPDRYAVMTSKCARPLLFAGYGSKPDAIVDVFATGSVMSVSSPIWILQSDKLVLETDEAVAFDLPLLPPTISAGEWLFVFGFDYPDQTKDRFCKARIKSCPLAFLQSENGLIAVLFEDEKTKYWSIPNPEIQWRKVIPHGGKKFVILGNDRLDNVHYMLEFKPNGRFGTYPIELKKQKGLFSGDDDTTITSGGATLSGGADTLLTWAVESGGVIYAGSSNGETVVRIMDECVFPAQCFAETWQHQPRPRDVGIRKVFDCGHVLLIWTTDDSLWLYTPGHEGLCGRRSPALVLLEGCYSRLRHIIPRSPKDGHFYLKIAFASKDDQKTEITKCTWKIQKH